VDIFLGVSLELAKTNQVFSTNLVCFATQLPNQRKRRSQHAQNNHRHDDDADDGEHFVTRPIGLHLGYDSNAPMNASNTRNSPTRLLIRCGSLVLPNVITRDQCIFVQDGVIEEIASHLDAPADTQIVDASDKIVLPGFIDTHVHGAMGADTMDATPEALHTMARFYAQHGVTGFLPTTMTAPREEIDAAVENVARYRAAQVRLGAEETREVLAEVLGVHIEGPYVNPRQCGAQPPQFMRPADPAEYGTWFATGVVKVITLAPEMGEANLKLIEYAISQNCAVAVGHTDATYDQTQRAFALGANQATHTFNAMRPLRQREPGVVGAVLNNSAAFAQLIADNWHVHPATMNVLYKCKGAEKIAVITDAMEATGLGEGEFKLGAHAVFVRNGKARLKDGTLAGSLTTMDVCLRNIIAATGCSLVEASRMCSHTPALSIGMGHRKGLVAKGYDADLVIVDAALSVIRTIVCGWTPDP
jgi:N-acetylglucosamine-6-phosphate deacetylase